MNIVAVTPGRWFIQYMGAEHGPYDALQLRQMAVAGSITAMSWVRAESGGDWFPVRHIPGVYSPRSWLVAAAAVDLRRPFRC